ncbi:hypothetical protein [Pedobacter ginsenosidimutans]|uniref:hypothetical protein n=1 Tax=Pedobacter ginsenosidimutans TaxID=687842 RepID=UPI000A47D445|nr:hypothetical protein [Pedobacter ginsenosidimutans]
MKTISKAKHKKINDLLESGRLIDGLNLQLQELGLKDFEVESLNIKTGANSLEFDFRTHICAHGFPQKQICSNGSCMWVCNHPG